MPLTMRVTVETDTNPQTQLIIKQKPARNVMEGFLIGCFFSPGAIIEKYDKTHTACPCQTGNYRRNGWRKHGAC